MASISSIKIIEGDFSLACLNKSLTRDAPTPTNISTKSEPDNEKNGTSASPATAFANNVLPVPGGPTKIAPFGILAPNRSEEHTSELQSRPHLVCRLLLEKKKKKK